jgi:hypothetical protein
MNRKIIVFILAILVASAGTLPFSSSAHAAVPVDPRHPIHVTDHSPPPTAKNAKEAKEAKSPKGPRPGNPGPGAQGPLETIAEMIAKQAAAKFATFALNESGINKLLGDKTSLDGLAAQIQALSDQLKDVQRTQTAILQDLKSVELNQFQVPLTTLVSSVQSLYTNEFLPTLEALQRYSDEATDPDAACEVPKSKCDKARTTFESTLAGFLTAAANAEGDNLAIHNFLMPGPTGSSAMAAYGAFLMAGPQSTGRLTSTDSERLYAFYTYYAEYEALATLLQAVRNTVRYEDLPSSFTSFIDTQVIGYQKLEREGLPPRIPPGTVITLPVAVESRTTTRNRPMWIWDFRVGSNLAWDPASPAGSAPLAPNCRRDAGTNRCAVDAAINTYNQTAAGLGFQDWRVPSRVEWDGLLTGQYDNNNRTDLRGFLLRMFPNSVVQGTALDQALTTNPVVWTADLARAPQVSCHLSGSGIGDAGKVVPVVHTAIPTRNTLRDYPAAFPQTNVPTVSSAQLQYPRGLTQSQGLQWCGDRLVEMVSAGFVPAASAQSPNGAQLVAVRTTTGDYMP